MDVPVLTGKRGWHRGQVPLRSVNDLELEVLRPPRRHRLRPWIRVLDRWKICRPVQTARIAILDRHRMWLGSLVVEEPWQPSVLCHRRRCRIGLQLAGKLLLQPLDGVRIEAADAPENVDVIRRRVKDVARARQISTRLDTRETARPSWSASRNTCRTAPIAARVRERRPEAITFTLTKIMWNWGHRPCDTRATAPLPVGLLS
jgi:hypothetical protein